MNLKLAAGTAILGLGLTAGADAQQTASVPAPVDVSKLPIDMSRIRRQLAQVTVREQRNGPNLRYIVDVFGQAPPIDLFSSPTDPNFWTGPAPYGAPTHRDMMNLNTPQEHRAPAADFSALFRWLADKSRDDKKTRK
jgi:hypothetical protein